jgi:uncharacterized protein YjiS (DUF1127 family)
MSLTQLFRRPAGAGRLLAAWTARRRHRGTLRALDDHLLDDIGITRTRALQEADKPFWRA